MQNLWHEMIALVILVIGAFIVPIERAVSRWRAVGRLTTAQKGRASDLTGGSGVGTGKKPAEKSAEGSGAEEAESSARPVFYVFAVVVLGYGALIGWRNRLYITAHADDFIYWGGLFLTMIGGMLANVVATNYRNHKNPIRLTLGQALFPLMFSVIVYYPILVLSGTAPRGYFAFYAAFLNGYFWETVVAKTQPPDPAAAGR